MRYSAASSPPVNGRPSRTAPTAALETPTRRPWLFFPSRRRCNCCRSISDNAGLGQNWCQYLTGDIGQSKVATLVAVSESLVIDAEEVEHCRVQVIYVHGVFNRGIAKFVGRAVSHAAFDSTARHENGE